MVPSTIDPPLGAAAVQGHPPPVASSVASAAKGHRSQLVLIVIINYRLSW